MAQMDGRSDHGVRRLQWCLGRHRSTLATIPIAAIGALLWTPALASAMPLSANGLPSGLPPDLGGLPSMSSLGEAGLTSALSSNPEIAPYSKHPSETRPFAICPPPTKTRTSCLAVGAPNPHKLAALNLPRPNYEGTGEGKAFSPEDLRSAYNLPKEGGRGMIVAITIAFDDPKAASDLAVYRETYGLPKCVEEKGNENACFRKVNQKGEESNYPEPNSNWAIETSLDLDMVSAVCPECHILLVEADVNELTDQGLAVGKAAEMGADVITNSWGIAGGFSFEAEYNHYFTHPGVPILFSSGDSGYEFFGGGFGYGADYPSTSPDVISAGGTSLKKAENSRGWSESAWTGAGSGCSEYEEKPGWQVDEVCAKRTVADVSAVADPGTPVSAYDSFETIGWWNLGGTSVAAPLMAGIEALSSEYARSLPGGDVFYADPGELFDVTAGNNNWQGTPCAAPAEDPVGRDYLCNSRTGYDGPTGNGSPNGPIEVTSLRPLAVTKSPTAVTGSAATLHGIVDAQNLATTYYFEYGLTLSYGVTTTELSAGSGSTAIKVNRELSGLSSNTLYHYRLVASSSAGISHGEDKTFRTAAPTVTGVSPSDGPAAGGTTVTISGVNFAGATAVKFGADKAESFAVESDATISAVAPAPTDGVGTVDITVTTPAGTSATSSADHFTDKMVGTVRAWAAGYSGELGNRHSQVAYVPMEVVDLHNAVAMSSSGGHWGVGSGGSTIGLTDNGTVMAWGEDWIGQLGNGGSEGYGGSQTAFMPVKVCAVAVATCPSGPYLEEVKAISTGYSFTLALLKNGTVVGWGNNYEGQLASGNRAECQIGGWVCSRTPVPVCVTLETPCKPEHYLRGVSAIATGAFHSLALLEDGTAVSWGLNEYGELGNGSFTGPELCGGVYPCSQVPKPVKGLSGVTAIGAGDFTSFALLSDGTVRAWGENHRGDLGDGTTTDRDTPVAVCATGEDAPCSHNLSGVTEIAGGGSNGYALLEDGTVRDWGLNFSGQLGIGEATKEGCNCIPTPIEVSGLTEVTTLAPGSSVSRLALLKDGRLMSWGTALIGNGELNGGYLPVRVCASYAAGPCPSGPYMDEEGQITAMGLGGAELVNLSTSPEWKLHIPPNTEGATESKLEWVSCSSSTACEATGWMKNNTGVKVSLSEHWNGSEWSIQSTPNPSGAKSSNLEWVSCTSSLSCEATGHYENSSGVVGTLAEGWNGSEWFLQSTPNPEGAKESKLYEVSCSSAVTCTAVGFYKNSSGVDVTLAERWNGTKWEVQSTPNPGGAQFNFLIGVSCTSSTACEATGYYVRSSGGAVPLAERWNGTNWTIQSSPIPEGAQNSYLDGASCTSSTACTAAGYYYNSSGTVVTLAERWNGTDWSVQSTPNPEGAKAAHLVGVSCTTATACTAAGDYVNSSGVLSPLAEVWNGSKWEVQSTPNPEGAKEGSFAGGVSCTSSSACTAVGNYTNSSGTIVTLAGRWGGTKWEVQSTPNRDGTGQGYFSGEPSCSSTTSCEATGLYVSTTGDWPMAESWNGAEWMLQWTPVPAEAKEGNLLSTSCTAATACTAAGYYKDSSGTQRTLAEHWDGSEWAIRQTPNPEGATGSQLTAVSCYSAAVCMATGYYKEASGAWLPLSERWDGTKWSIQTMAIPSGSKGTWPEGVSCISSSVCESTGFYENSLGAHVSFAEVWNGTTWEVQSTPNPEEGKESRLFGVSCVSSTSCESTGYYETASGGRFAFAEGYDGAKWQVQSPPLPNGAKESHLFGVSCASSNLCEAIAWYQNDAEEIAPFAERWTGSAWALQLVPSPEDARGTYLGGVSCTSSATCAATGFYVNSASHFVPLSANYGRVAPVVTTRSATPVSETGATLNGTVNPNGSGTEYYFEYGATTSYGSTTAPAYMAAGTSTLDKSTVITGLEAGHQYHFRIVASSSAGTSKGADQVFTAKVKPPTASSEAATNVMSNEATMNGTVNPEGTATSYYFEYGLTTSYGMVTLETSAGAGTGNVKESNTLSGLQPESTYHYQIVATNGESTATGEDKTFKTSSSLQSQLSRMAVTDPFNGGTSAISNFSSNWSALGWASGTTPKGLDRSSGWGPSDAYPTVNGAYYAPIVTDVGPGIADVATMAANPSLENRYFSLWLDMSSPSSTRSGYELRFTDVSTGRYNVTLSKWLSGTQTVLASKSNFAFANGNSFALADQGGTVSAWTNSGSGFAQLLGANDSSFSGGNAGVEGSGNYTRLTNFKVGALLAPVANMDAALKALPVNDPFATNESPLSGGGAWAALAWDNSTSGHNTGRVSGGWGPYDAYPTINGAYWQKASFADTGSGDAVAVMLYGNPTIASRYFSLWLDAPSPATARSGYELRFTETSSTVYEVTVSKWQAGTKTVLASKTSYSFPNGSLFALVDKAGTVSAWTKTASEYTQLLSASDATFTSGYTGIEGSGNITRLKEFRSSPLAPF